MNRKKTGSRFVRHLELCQQAEAQKERPEPLSLELLNRIAVADFADQPLNVTTLMGMRDLASSATIHRKMRGLIGQEWIELQPEPDNRRLKHLRLTSKSLLHYRERERQMLAAILE
jgi:hypothetical protein